MEKNIKTIVITGSTRGIGFALAGAFLQRNCCVVISGRQQLNVDASVKNLGQNFSSGSIAGFAADVSSFDQIQNLWNKALEEFGSVDIWINNAGVSNQLNPFWKISPEEMRCVIETNVLGEMFGTSVAMTGFIKQGFGALYNMEGMGAKSNRKVAGLSIYGSSKSALGYFNDAIASENNFENILVGSLQPGMMLTDMVMCQYEGRPEEWEKVKGILTALSEDENVVSEWLADKILANRKNGVRLKYSGTLRMIKRLIKRKLDTRQN